MGVLSAFFYALYAIFSKTASNRGYDTFTIIFYSILAISLVLLPLTDWGSFGAFLAEALVGNTVFTLAHAAFTTILPYALYTLSQLYLDGGMVAILASGGPSPTAACLFGAVFFQEYPSLWNLAGPRRHRGGTDPPLPAGEEEGIFSVRRYLSKKTA